MELIHPLAEAYAAKYSSPEEPVLKQIADSTRQNHSHHHMLSGHLQGSFLQMLSEIMQPRYILEIGTFTGYSAVCLSRGLQAGGVLHTIELREDDADTARKNFNLAGVEEKIILHCGNALDIVPALDYPWDLVFIDADKPGYIKYYDLVIGKLRKGGVILADNVLFHGQVLEQEVTGKSAKAVQEFNEYLQKDESINKVLLTIRDGLFMILKK